LIQKTDSQHKTIATKTDSQHKTIDKKNRSYYSLQSLRWQKQQPGKILASGQGIADRTKRRTAEENGEQKLSSNSSIMEAKYSDKFGIKDHCVHTVSVRGSRFLRGKKMNGAREFGQ
jgi:hypothetical protein